MTLGELIDALAALPADAPIRFDHGAAVGGFSSWRGIYAELTLTPGGSEEWRGNLRTCGELLAAAQKADGATFEGYKGGEYTMKRSTAVWGDDDGQYLGRMLLGVEREGGAVAEQYVIRTFIRPYEYA